MATPSPESDNRRQRGHEYVKYTGLAFQMGATIAVGILLGRYLDQRLHTTHPYFTALLALLFSVAAIYLAVKDFLKKS